MQLQFSRSLQEHRLDYQKDTTELTKALLWTNMQITIGAREKQA